MKQRNHFHFLLLFSLCHKVEAVLRNYSALVLNYPRAQHLSLKKKKKKRSKNDFKGSVPALEELFISLLPADIKEQVSKPGGGTGVMSVVKRQRYFEVILRV